MIRSRRTAANGLNVRGRPRRAGTGPPAGAVQAQHAEQRAHHDAPAVLVPARDAAIRAPGLGGQRTFSPLAAVLGERITPELSYLQARFAGLVSYGLSADLLGSPTTSTTFSTSSTSSAASSPATTRDPATSHYRPNPPAP